MYGKAKCKILKEIRRRIAAENEIPFVTRECTFQGSCRGTCPKCESELRYLEQQLGKRQRLGKAVTLSALSLSLLVGTAACEPLFGDKPVSQLEGDVPYVSDTAPPDTAPELETFEGEPLLPEKTEPVKGELSATEDIDFLEGDVAYVTIPTGETEELLLGMLPYTTEERSETEPAGDE